MMRQQRAKRFQHFKRRLKPISRPPKPTKWSPKDDCFEERPVRLVIGDPNSTTTEEITLNLLALGEFAVIYQAPLYLIVNIAHGHALGLDKGAITFHSLQNACKCIVELTAKYNTLANKTFEEYTACGPEIEVIAKRHDAMFFKESTQEVHEMPEVFNEFK